MMMTTLDHIDEHRWELVVRRERDDRFRFGVTTTGIYCRSGCPARTPRREHVRAFADARAAEEAGFRACKRCEPDEATPDAARQRAIERACALLDGPSRRRSMPWRTPSGSAGSTSSACSGARSA